MIKPSDFKEANITIPSHPVMDGMYDNIPLHYREGLNISCWRIPLADRLRILFSGRLFLGVFGGQPPVFMQSKKPFRNTREN